jgi:hypothetical protein
MKGKERRGEMKERKTEGGRKRKRRDLKAHLYCKVQLSTRMSIPLLCKLFCTVLFIHQRLICTAKY